MSEHSNLYVAGLPTGLDDSTFRQLFEGFGDIVSAKCISDKQYGFVKFNDVDEAQNVIDAMHGFEYNGTQLIVRFADKDRQGKGKGKSTSWTEREDDARWSSHMKEERSRLAESKSDAGATPRGRSCDGVAAERRRQAFEAPADDDVEENDNLYLTDLPEGMTDEWLNEVFSAYGDVLSTRVLRNEGSSIALLRMGSVEQAVWLVENLHGNIPQGLEDPVQVRYADTAAVKARKAASKGQARVHNPRVMAKAVPRRQPVATPHMEKAQDLGRPRWHCRLGVSTPKEVTPGVPHSPTTTAICT